MFVSVYKSHQFHQLNVKIIAESATFPFMREAAGAVIAVVSFHLLQAVSVLNPNLPCSQVMPLRQDE